MLCLLPVIRGGVGQGGIGSCGALMYGNVFVRSMVCSEFGPTKEISLICIGLRIIFSVNVSVIGKTICGVVCEVVRAPSSMIQSILQVLLSLGRRLPCMENNWYVWSPFVMKRAF